MLDGGESLSGLVDHPFKSLGHLLGLLRCQRFYLSRLAVDLYILTGHLHRHVLPGRFSGQLPLLIVLLHPAQLTGNYRSRPNRKRSRSEDDKDQWQRPKSSGQTDPLSFPLLFHASSSLLNWAQSLTPVRALVIPALDKEAFNIPLRRGHKSYVA